MKYIHFSVTCISLFLIITFTTTWIDAEENNTDPKDNTSISLSGKVIDTEGQPIPEFTFSIQSSKNPNNRIHPPVVRVPELSSIRPIIDNNIDVTQNSNTIVKTDAEGTYNVSNIRPGFISIIAIPKEMLNERKNAKQKKKGELIPDIPHQHIVVDLNNVNKKVDMQIVSIRLNKITFYTPLNRGPIPGMMFGIKPGVNLKDVIITVKRSLKIRSQVVYKDGTPVANKNLNTIIYYHGGPNGGGVRTDHSTSKTDPDGFFTQSREEPGLYTIKMDYKGLTGAVGPFMLDQGVHPKELVLRLNGNPADMKSPEKKTAELKQDKARIVVRNFLGNNRPNNNAEIKSERIVWIINPANGHAYAKIKCDNWHDAQRKAIDEKAHLVSINDQDELFWIQTIFPDHYYWIGLNDIEDEGIWRWDSGEPVTFTNWTNRSFFGDNSPDSEKDYVALMSFYSSWEAVGPNVLNSRMIRYAIIEKDGLVSKIPKSKEATED